MNLHPNVSVEGSLSPQWYNSAKASAYSVQSLVAMFWPQSRSVIHNSVFLDMFEIISNLHYCPDALSQLQM